MKGVYVSTEKGIRVNKISVHKLVAFVSKELKKKINSLEINFVGNETIYEINSTFLSHKYETDVISFDYSNENNSFDGEIFISVEKARENSKRFKVLLDDELKRLVIHGMLHFSGYDDVTASKRRGMKKAEDQFLYQCKKIKLLKNL